MIFPFERWYRLVPRGCPGLVCDAAGVALGAVDLARAGRDAGGVCRCEVRSENAIATVLRLAYGPRADAVVSRLDHGLRRAAGWIEAGDLCLASIEMVLLGVPDLTAEGMAKLAEIADLEKSGTGWENQPRIAGGRAGGGQWTTDGVGAPATDNGFVGTAALALDDGVYRPDVDHLVPSLVAGIEDEPFRGSNGPPPDEVTSQKRVFPGFEPGATAAILAPVDGFLGFSALADAVNLEATVATYRRLFAEIKSVDPTFVDEEILPQGGIAGLSWEGRNSLIDHLLMARASALYRPRGDIGFFPGFRPLNIDAGGVRFAGVVGGAGPPLLLLHGYPQTHIAWRKVAPALAQSQTVIIPDLPGYGASRPLSMTPRWTKRRVGVALVTLMQALGYGRFALAGHDRGARAGYRLVLDHPGIVSRFASLAVVPTLDAMLSVDYHYAQSSYHWFLFAQEADLPERLLAAAPDEVIDRAFKTMKAESDSVIEPAAREAYRAAFRDAGVRHAICEDYRAGLDEDLAHDRADRVAGRKLDCPVLALWPRVTEVLGRPDQSEIWRGWADDVTGGFTTGDHLQPEDRPKEVAGELIRYFQKSS